MNSGAMIQNCSSVNGAGVDVNGGNLTINDGAVIQNCTATSAGGGVYVREGNFALNGGSITGNHANDGGGIFLYSGTTTINNARITGNTADRYGGGIYGWLSTFAMKNSKVSGNVAGDSGGGVLFFYSLISMSDNSINDNEASGVYGGGIYLTPESKAEITGASSIINNSAPNGDGGGIYTEDGNYNNLITGSDTVFRGNTASAAYIPPEDAETLYPAIQFASTSLSTHPLNNFDINSSGEPFTYHVSYDANGGKGSYSGPGTAPGETDTVLSLKETEISRTGYTFTGWNTEPDGSGYSYALEDNIVVDDNVTLYAQWTAGQTIKIVGIVFMFILLTAILVLLIVDTFWVKACVIVNSMQ